MAFTLQYVGVAYKTAIVEKLVAIGHNIYISFLEAFMKRESRLFTTLGLGALLFATANVAMAQDRGSYSNGASSGAPASSTSAPGIGTVTNQTTTESTTTAVPTDTTTTETTSYDAAPLANTGGEPWMFVLGGLTLAASALMFRRRVGGSA